MSLNPEQIKAVETTEGPVLVLSGAGTGKTTVLTARLVHIVQSEKARPYECLAVTFTNKAAEEIKERLEAMIGVPAKSLWLGTFHRMCLRILRMHPKEAGLDKDFTILDAADQERLMKEVLKELNVDTTEVSPSLILNQIQRLKDQGLTPLKAQQQKTPKTLSMYYSAYQSRLQRMNAVDFGDLLLLCLELFLNNPDILAIYQRQFKYILVDEYQDTNVAQYLWLRLLAQGHDNLCCVGDDDQSIYSWRGAEVGNILKFEKDFKNAVIIRLEQNYRSTKHILGGASSLIAHNKERLGKTLRVGREENENGEKISVSNAWNAEEEAVRLCENIERHLRAGVPLNKMAVLVRASFQTGVIENKLVSYGIPYKIIAGFKFYEREEIKDALAYLKLMFYPKDDVSFQRIVNKPRRGFGDAALQTLHAVARKNGIGLYEAGKIALDKDLLKGAAKKGLQGFYDLFEKREGLKEIPPYELLKILINESGYMEMWQAQTDKSLEAQGKIENLKELVADLRVNFQTVEEFLEHVTLRSENDALTAGGEYISVMTLHASKGLEFDVVFLTGWEEGLFPHQRSLDEGGLEEERRLAYVGLTRARNKAYISFATSRQTYGQWQNNLPSRFIAEIAPEHIDFKTPFKTFVPESPEPFFKKSAAPFFKSEKKRAFQIGTKVYHKTYGRGQVIESSETSVDVLFENGQLKKILAEYLELA